METTLLSVFAFGACTSVALTGPVPQAAGAKDRATAEAHAAGPVALTEAEMDGVAAGGVVRSGPRVLILDEPLASSLMSNSLTGWQVIE